MPGSNGFRWMGADAYLFDIDGTLMRSRDRVHFNALNYAMLGRTGSKRRLPASRITARPTRAFFAPRFSELDWKTRPSTENWRMLW